MASALDVELGADGEKLVVTVESLIEVLQEKADILNAVEWLDLAAHRINAGDQPGWAFEGLARGLRSLTQDDPGVSVEVRAVDRG